MTRSLEASLGGRTPEDWAEDFLSAARFPVTYDNVRAVVSWEYAESGAGGGMYNPLNTTQGGYAGETDFNSVGVKNYVRYADGIAANAKVVHNGYYPAVIAAFLRGNSARTACDAVTRSPWGTGYIALRSIVWNGTPASSGEPMFVASPHAPQLKGRQAAACWSPATPNVVVLTNGASIRNDRAVGGGKRQWSPPLPPGAHGVGIMATIDGHGRPDGRGVVFQDDRMDTYVGLWS